MPSTCAECLPYRARDAGGVGHDQHPGSWRSPGYLQSVGGRDSQAVAGAGCGGEVQSAVIIFLEHLPVLRIDAVGLLGLVVPFQEPHGKGMAVHLFGSTATGQVNLGG